MKRGKMKTKAYRLNKNGENILVGKAARVSKTTGVSGRVKRIVELKNWGRGTPVRQKGQKESGGAQK